jgi:dolichol-phosphate mannosyltransferase
MSEDVPRLTAVLPCYNERENLGPLMERLVPVLDRAGAGRYEAIFVDDGSTDGSGEILDRLSDADPRIKVLHFSRNFGHQAALAAGLEASTGATVVLMDCDLQDPPEVIEAFLARWREGYEVVYAIRRARKEGPLKRAAYKLFYRSVRAIAEIDIPPDAGDFCLLDRAVVDVLVSLRERHAFLRGLRSWVGFRQVGVEYERQARFAGVPKYTLRKLVRLAVSGYIGFSAAPLRLATWLGFGAAAIGFGLALWAIATRLLHIPAPRGWASTLAIVLFLGGAQLLVLGVIGEYLGRVYDEVRARPNYIVRRRAGFGPVQGGPRDAARGAEGTEPRERVSIP